MSPRPNGSKRILVVDDDRNIRFLAERILTGAGYRVEFATDGEEAVAKILGSPPDLVILDLTLPALDGWGVLQRLKDVADRPPVVVLTAHGDYGALPGQVREAATAYLTKPFSLRQLVSTCEGILAASVAPPSA